nr:MAG TPA: hypothetical protein [Caudoviricetes sp.]
MVLLWDWLLLVYIKDSNHLWKEKIHQILRRTNDDGIYHINVSDYVALFIHYIDMGRMEVSAGGGDT